MRALYLATAIALIPLTATAQDLSGSDAAQAAFDRQSQALMETLGNSINQETTDSRLSDMQFEADLRQQRTEERIQQQQDQLEQMQMDLDRAQLDRAYNLDRR